ncbi:MULTISPECIES: 3-hydroxybutyrate dehydrogenase [unclassified Hyphomonas]|jgi:3-hydroxybutyrate dehydrogenase|uniref:3-hydroxybutyrate dehydrogenase n=1 Tax=unclassified Hyphomonas TaxID=2630699 RepID=UPI000C5686BF|nr:MULTISPECIES: 3-hydroxybutyrate dehydrogenase [unclassified Hyphomonas]MAN90405.1 3-hydroxybutyrate dehydrogenase [Hyphomonadaceae bacterium]MAA81652.1 3-hydroxybutyrate dehydrogenase [Hyphomonas sp.]MDF1805869.1 3-hydroxybutyrate dehydrogenase [Hyphomonas sp.]QSR20955.1 3-hydroxybutyrate dehydrogenase [Hyphomonas sp. KY3]RCL88798.1 MAG: 3-hydroxybutyrate dehydrogenase [Hyphomonas sp.]|tara:strand:- start:369 stop:1151 length:783 start_codon:yes stop_codon:yes gene_type:complete
MIKGKTALVTGSTSGIGKAIADRLAQEGCNVVLNGFGDADEIKALQAEMGKEHGVQIGYSGADLTNPDAIEEMMAYVTTDFGGTDILVNNAGTQFVSPLEEFPVAKWDLIMALNLSAAFHTTRMAIGPMKEKGWGRIINTGSAHAKVASPFKSAYVAAKHGLSGLTKVTALEGAEHGVRCNLVCPGYVHTPLVDGQIDDTAKARGMTRDEVVKNVLLAAQPTKEFVTAEQIGGFVAFLCSPDADQINGADLSMDGGWVAQ